MIYSLKINKKFTGYYDFANKLFKPGLEINFKPGVNIVIGKNGSGKTTLLDMIRYIFLCKESYCSSYKCTTSNYLFCNKDNYTLLDSVELKADYRLIMFNLLEREDLNLNSHGMAAIDECFNSFKSKGEKQTRNFQRLLRVMFNPKDIRAESLSFVELIEKLKANKGDKLSKKLVDYYAKHNDERLGRRTHFTVLLDEPDISLDIDNVKKLDDMFIIGRDDTQIISIIHNPYLIKRIHDLNINVNFIEVTKGYLNKVLKALNK